MKRVALFGSRGQLGVELKSEFTARGYEVACFDRSTVDITDAALVERSVAACDPAVVLNAAAYNQVDVAETEPLAAFQVNALAVRNLAVACRNSDAQLVHFSTDYVFDGQAGRAYREEDPTRPLGAYAVSKLAGELYAQAYLDAPLIIRTSGVFGPGGMDTARGNFVELMLRLAAQNNPIRVVEDHVASPTYAPALAARTADLVERGDAWDFPHRRRLADLLVRLGGQDLRGRWAESAAQTYERARIPYRRPEAQVLGTEQFEDRGSGARADAVAG